MVIEMFVVALVPPFTRPSTAQTYALTTPAFRADCHLAPPPGVAVDGGSTRQLG